MNGYDSNQCSFRFRIQCRRAHSVLFATCKTCLSTSRRYARPQAHIRSYATAQMVSRSAHDYSPNCLSLWSDVFRHRIILFQHMCLCLGPTNSGKTYSALQRFNMAKSGVYCGPLRLLASEVYQRTNAEGLSDVFYIKQFVAV